MIFNWLKKEKTVEPCCTPDPEYPDYAVPLFKLETETYFYDFAIKDGKRVPADVYRVVGRWIPSDRIAARGWMFDDGERDLAEFDSGAMVVPVALDDISGRGDIHINDLLVCEDCTAVRRVVAILIDDCHIVQGFRLESPSWVSWCGYTYDNVMITDIHKYKKVLPIGFATIPEEGKE